MESKDKMVAHPTHYQSSNGIECIQAIEAATEGLQGIEAVCTANAIKYLWRWKKKNGKQDLEKAKWYIDYLIKKTEQESKTISINPKNGCETISANPEANYGDILDKILKANGFTKVDDCMDDRFNAEDKDENV